MTTDDETLRTAVARCERCREPMRNLKGAILHHQVECPKCGHPTSYAGLGIMTLEYETIPDLEETK